MVEQLPLMLAGPVLRHISSTYFSCWFASSKPLSCQLKLLPKSAEPREIDAREGLTCFQAAEQLWIYQLRFNLNEPLPPGWINYELLLQPEGSSQWQGFAQWGDDSFCYEGQTLPGFYLSTKVHRLFHGSCRKPHYDSGDGLVAADQLLSRTPPEEWPSPLILSGDQVYCDDVAAPMLRAIHQSIERLGFNDESLPQCKVPQASDLHQNRPYYYHRSELLPLTESGQDVAETLFRGVRKPIFTSDSANNHLMSLAEVLTMYLMVWSPELWRHNSCDLTDELKSQLSASELELYGNQQKLIAQFAQGLKGVRRLLAHLPTAMIFDDHDVTDDWNLSAAWEETAYSNPLSRRIIGNSLLGYYLFQGQGNELKVPDTSLAQQLQQALSQPGSAAHEECLEHLFDKPDWGYSWPLEPSLVVLDTRTQRWRSERGYEKPSGLMDYEALKRLQHTIEGKDAVLLVSPAPVIGVKLIEAIQHLFTFFGKPLMVDAESWMAHPGAARAMLRLFKDPKTPERFVILSGDVHYSFVFGVRLKQALVRSDVWQITSSGIKNEFPKRLLSLLDLLNRWLYSPKSPLNWFTKRRQMKITPYLPQQSKKGHRLLNASGIGLVELNEKGAPKSIYQLCCEGQLVEFKRSMRPE